MNKTFPHFVLKQFDALPRTSTAVAPDGFVKIEEGEVNVVEIKLPCSPRFYAFVREDHPTINIDNSFGIKGLLRL
ncbi:hypothetical protein [Pseudoalteromonas aurantia]|uniref:hypothetical protein n=1 Tax=Pseudoalteromonas aurantia TaxID=43654 RepID=UPI00110C172F|nr:hypothetical protein [Pseudoalteromonas aurantia]